MKESKSQKGKTVFKKEEKIIKESKDSFPFAPSRIVCTQNGTFAPKLDVLHPKRHFCTLMHLPCDIMAFQRAVRMMFSLGVKQIQIL